MIPDTNAAPSPAPLAPLADSDFDRLDELLARLDHEDTMIVEELDGFLAALACVPEPVSEDEWLAVALGIDPSASGDAAVGDMVALLRRHARHVRDTLDSGRFAPVLGYDERGDVDGSAWAVGFLRAIELHPESWDAMLDEKDFGDALDAVEALASTLDDEPAAPAPTPAQRQASIDRMIGDVADIHEFFRPYRESGTTPQGLRVETLRRSQPKVGRNDPCPCGSGRKHKHCCGAG